MNSQNNSGKALGSILNNQSKEMLLKSVYAEQKELILNKKDENSFRVLAFGDIIGDPGRKALFTIFTKIKTAIEPDLVILNGENSAHGFGITNVIAKQLFEGGIDVITTGNHVWQKKEVFEFLDKYPGLLRPINYPPNTPGSWSFYL